MRILGLDFGDKTIGVAVSDPFGWTAQGVEIIRRENSMEFKKCMRRLAELVEQYQAETIVLGYPKNLDGSEGDRCVKTKDFCERVKRRFPKAEVLLWDERFSTIAAERSLREVGLNHNQRKSVQYRVPTIHRNGFQYLRQHRVQVSENHFFETAQPGLLAADSDSRSTSRHKLPILPHNR